MQVQYPRESYRTRERQREPIGWTEARRNPPARDPSSEQFSRVASHTGQSVAEHPTVHESIPDQQTDEQPRFLPIPVILERRDQLGQEQRRVGVDKTMVDLAEDAG